MTMPFGKFRGTRLEDVPASYLGWVLEECSSVAPTLRHAILAELAERFDLVPVLDMRPPAPAVPPALRALAQDVVRRGYRALAREHHPDTGGRHEMMQALNAATEALRAVCG